MTYEVISNRNTSEGLHVLFQYAADVVPILTPLILFAFFTIIVLASFFSQKRLTGRGDFSASFAVAGYVTLGLAFIFFLIEGIINIFTLVVTFGVAVFGTLWLLISRDK